MILKHKLITLSLILTALLLSASCRTGSQDRTVSDTSNSGESQDSGDMGFEATPKPSPTPQILSDSEEKQMEGLAEASLDKAITDYGEAYSLDDRIRAVGDLNGDRKLISRANPGSARADLAHSGKIKVMTHE